MTRPIQRCEIVDRCARLIAADPDMPIEDAYQYVTGWSMGRWAASFTDEITLRAAEHAAPDHRGDTTP